MPSAKKVHKLTVSIDWPGGADGLSFETDTHVRKEIWDHIRITPNEIVFTFSRSSKLMPTESFANKTRQDQLSYTLLAISLTTEGRVPRIASAELDIEGTTAPVEIDRNLRTKFEDWAHVHTASMLPWDVARELFLTGEKARCLRTASSHLLSSVQHNTDEQARLRDLWSSFNCLYRYSFYAADDIKCCFVSGKPAYSDNAGLQYCASLLNDSDRAILSGRSKEVYERAVKPILDDLSWGFIAAQSLLSRSQKPKEDIIKTLDVSTARRIQRALDKRIESSKDKPSKDEVRKALCALRNSLTEQIDGLTENEANEIAFLITRYLYNLRCRSMHGETAHRLFCFKEDPVLMSLNKLLESVIVDMMVYIARGEGGARSKL